MTVAPVPGAPSLVAAYGHEVVPLHHDLDASGLLSVDALASAALRLPPRCVEHHVGDLPPVLPSGKAAQRAEPVDAVIRALHDNGCWVMLSGLEGLDEYAAVLHATKASVAEAVAANRDTPRCYELAAFVAGPRAVVPVHVDRHHNLLLQLAGHKTVWIGTYDEPAVGQAEVERRYGREHRNPVRRPEREARYELGPGQGLYIPPFAFHRIEGAGDVSVAVSCGVRTERSEGAVLVHRGNSSLRRFGIRPAPPGRSRADRVKANAVRVQDVVTRLVRS